MSTRSRILIAAGLVGLGLTAAIAHDRGPEGPRGGRWGALSPEDRAALTDARIAALHAGLKLSPDQETLWPPVETALRDMARLRREQGAGMRDRPRFSDDPPAALRAMADAASARGDALRRLADATQPLYATLQPDQKRRAMILARPMGRMHGMGRGPGHEMGHGEMRDDGGPGGPRRGEGPGRGE